MDYMYANEEGSSGCESGWTLYLDQSSISPQNESCSHSRRNPSFDKTKRLKEDEEEEDEDLSMVSDASSGPPHLHEEEGYAGNHDNINHYTVDETLSRNYTILNKKKNRENRRRNKAQDQHSSLLDDTASSPFFDFSNKSFNPTRTNPSMENVLEYSQGYSTTQFEVRPPYQQHYDFFQASQLAINCSNKTSGN